MTTYNLISGNHYVYQHLMKYWQHFAHLTKYYFFTPCHPVEVCHKNTFILFVPWYALKIVFESGIWGPFTIFGKVFISDTNKMNVFAQPRKKNKLTHNNFFYQNCENVLTAPKCHASIVLCFVRYSDNFLSILFICAIDSEKVTYCKNSSNSFFKIVQNLST